MNKTVARAWIVLFVYIGSAAISGVLGISFGHRGAPRWYALIAPVILTAIAAGLGKLDELDDEEGEVPIKSPAAAVWLVGSFSLAAAIAGYFYGPSIA